MRLEPTPRPEQTLRVSARLITSSTILHLSADELERSVNQEQMENPALDVVEQRVCLFCGTRMYGQVCSACGHHALPSQLSQTPRVADARIDYDPDSQWHNQQQTFYDIDNYGFAEADSEDEFDPIARIPTNISLSETLLQQLETLIPPDDATIAEQLVGNLNERGYLEISLEEVAFYLQVSVARVAYVLSQLQTLEPLGIGARNLRECLLIQLDALSELEPPPPLVHTLITNHLDQLGQNQFHELARTLKASEQEIHHAALYIRSTLHPFPAHTYSTEISSYGGSGATYIRPDIIVRKSEAAFEIEIVEEKRYHFHIGTAYNDQLGEHPSAFAANEVQRYMHQQSDRARFFVDCIQRRWRTLRRVAELVVHYQREFLERGVRYLRPLTRAEVASRLSLDEGTVSRATANKYLLLPNGRLMPFSDFFDSSLGIKDILRELIQEENPRHPLSDEELARQLNAQGIPMARRTVTKYREEMGIGSSRERQHHTRVTQS
jgi:RNA polymerase sigma-54 factor